ncbi:MAG: nucleoside 2-deoxyribosyltransferase [Chloroflexi bacterium]|nr:nucleoside 2-deoxyribosyltransferase [Chloroflexota bacterium]
MNIYFSCSITGGRAEEEVYQNLVDFLLAEGHHVPTAHLSNPDVLAMDGRLSPQEVYSRDMAWLHNCDAVVAEVSTPSHGVGYEIAAALDLGKPVLCCYREGRRISKMISGNTHPGLRLREYRTPDEARNLVRDFIDRMTKG